MRRFVAKIIKLIFGVVLIALGVGMFMQPVAGSYFYPGGKYSGPHTRHFSEGDMKVVGVMLVIFGLALVYSIFFCSSK